MLIRYCGIVLGIILPCTAVFIEQSSAAPALDLVVDTDTGVDDATALVWLLSQTDYSVNVLGIGTVVGNTSPMSAANNVLTILDATSRRDIPVAVGATQPLAQPLSPGPFLGLRTPALLHGSDGLWSIGLQHPHAPTDFDSRDAATLYRDLGNTNPGATLLALGPLTNIALAFARYPDAMRRYGRIVIGASAKYGGNRAPSAEYSLWQDPEALSMVLSSRLGPSIVILPLDSFHLFSMNLDEANNLCANGRAALKLICPALTTYVGNQLSPLIGRTSAWVPDVATTMYALDSSLGATLSGLIKVVGGGDIMRGHSEIALTLLERITLIGSDAELNQLTEFVFLDPPVYQAGIARLLAREPDNATVVVNIDADTMHWLFHRAVTSNQN
jgi:purine nucleosidase